MGTCSGPCFLPRQSLLLPSRGIRPFPRPFKQRIALAHDHCFPPGLHFSQVAEIVGFKARLQRELRAISSTGFCQPCCSSLSFPGKFWLEPDANRPKFLLPGPSQHPNHQTRGFPGAE